MTAKLRPEVRQAGQTSHIALRPAIAQTSQKGTMREKNGSCRPVMAERAWRSRPVTDARTTIGVPSAP